MRKWTSIFIYCLSFYILYSQQEEARLYFKDKPNSNTFLESPLSMLTQRALDRRTRQGILIDEKDIPLEESYVSAIANREGISVKARSKWLNALHIRGNRSNISLLLSLPYVDHIEGISTHEKRFVKSKTKPKKDEKITQITDIDYDYTANQNEMLNVNFLHDMGYTGNTMHIAIIDSGFKGVETINVFQRLRDGNTANGEIIGGYDFVNRNTNFYADTGNTHGLSVLSTIGGYLENKFVGTSPDAQFYLFITEDPANETPLEESLWVEAAERADSLGVDIINTSLGYTTFDDSRYNYSYSDMDGQTTFISRGAELASSRGIILVTSAGNQGASTWHYISAPADAVSTLSVGAVDSSERIVDFSSFGPTSDNRIKPDLLAQGKHVSVIDGSGALALSNGTSFSSPILAGAVACLWQIFPRKTASEIIQIVKESGDLYDTPTSQRGYGIPDFRAIFNNLHVDNLFDKLTIFPNPAETFFQIQHPDGLGGYKIKVIDIFGNMIIRKNVKKSTLIIDISDLSVGIYFVEVELNSRKKTMALLKK